MRPWVLVALLAGCTSATPDDAPDVDDPPTDDVPLVPERVVGTVVTNTLFDWEGRTKEGVWVCPDQDGTGACPAGQQVMPDGAHVAALDYAANLTALNLTMTWTAADATQTGLVIAAISGGNLLGHVRGTSPVALELEPEGAGDGTVVLMVWPEGKTQTSPSVFVDATRQDFRVEGVLTTSDQVWMDAPTTDTQAMRPAR